VRAARDKIAGRMVLLDETLADSLPIIFDFLAVPDPERPAPTLGPEARQRQFLVRRLARARSARPSLPTRVRQSGGIIYCRGREVEYG
jgi:hypothetical protein